MKGTICRVENILFPTAGFTVRVLNVGDDIHCFRLNNDRINHPPQPNKVDR